MNLNLTNAIISVFKPTTVRKKSVNRVEVKTYSDIREEVYLDGEIRRVISSAAARITKRRKAQPEVQGSIFICNVLEYIVE